MKIIKNTFIILIIFCVIIFSFLLPKLLFKLEDLRMEKIVYSSKKNKSKIDVQAEKIYLVKAIHAMSDSSTNISTVKVVGAENSKKTIEKDEKMFSVCKREMKKLQESKILKNFDENLLLNFEFSGEELNYTDSSELYTFEFIDLYFKENEVSRNIDIRMEEKTEKIFLITIPKGYLCDELENEDILINFVKYMDLLVIGDWKFEKMDIKNTDYNICKSSLKSEKAQLVAELIELKGDYYLTIKTFDQDKELNQHITEYNLY